MRPTRHQLIEQLSRLKETPLPDGFEAALHERLVAVSQQPGAAVLPFRRSRRKATFVLIAALSVPLAAAAASGVLSHYWKAPAKSAESAPESVKAAAARKSSPRPSKASVPEAPSEMAEPVPSSAVPAVGQSAGSAPERAIRPSAAPAESSSEKAGARAPGADTTEEPAAAKETTAPVSSGAKPNPASAPLEQLDLSWPNGTALPRTGTKGTSSSSSTSSSATAASTSRPATTGLRHAGQEQGAGERARVQNREAHGRTEGGRPSEAGQRGQRGAASQQRQMKRGQ